MLARFHPESPQDAKTRRLLLVLKNEIELTSCAFGLPLSTRRLGTDHQLTDRS